MLVRELRMLRKDPSLLAPTGGCGAQPFSEMGQTQGRHFFKGCCFLLNFGIPLESHLPPAMSHVTLDTLFSSSQPQRVSDVYPVPFPDKHFLRS